ncbi:MAG: GtrA family protein [Spirochaetales bacterium]|nr:GtrA family protein [Spirochaetales bacterium]
MTKKTFWKKHGTFILYNIFGLSATALETACYWLFFSKLEMGNVVSTIIATFITITYAFFTNKILVYKSKDWRLKTMYAEVSEFYGFRILTGLFNVGYMYLTVSILDWPPVLMKIISALIVGLMNYLLGKKIVFKNRRRRRRKKTVESN